MRSCLAGETHCLSTAATERRFARQREQKIKKKEIARRTMPGSDTRYVPKVVKELLLRRGKVEAVHGAWGSAAGTEIRCRRFGLALIRAERSERTTVEFPCGKSFREEKPGRAKAFIQSPERR